MSIIDFIILYAASYTVKQFKVHTIDILIVWILINLVTLN